MLGDLKGIDLSCDCPQFQFSWGPFSFGQFCASVKLLSHQQKHPNGTPGGLALHRPVFPRRFADRARQAWHLASPPIEHQATGETPTAHHVGDAAEVDFHLSSSLAYAKRKPCLVKGSVWIRSPVALKIALQTAGRMGGKPGSPRPFGVLFVLTKCTSMGGASGILKTGCW